ncbi:MAG TPA: hypothetical protein GX707_14320 [Epulopiscium sp.]|nr:hypothetical protein [Candidatus Epulonipiscium sp.]
MQDFRKQVLRFITDRLFIMSIFMVMLFSVIILRVYDLQIIHHDEYDVTIRETIRREIETDAPRGLIFDRYGRPIAINQPTYVLNVDQGIKMTNAELNDILLRLIKLLKSNGDEYVDEIPITKEKPFEYRFGESSTKQFINSIPHKNKEEKEKAQKYTAEELLDYLKSDIIFDMDPLISDEDARELAALRYELYKTSWSKYKLITVATDVSMETISTVEEKNKEYRGVTTDVKSVRFYPEGELFAHILGYTRQITASQFEAMEQYGYEKEDIVGQMGLEQTQEEQLRGIKGSEIVEVDNRGRKVRTVEKEDEVAGNNVFVTMDLKYQRKVYDILENQLTNIMLQRLRGGEKDIQPISGKEMLYSIVESNTLSFTKMKKSTEGSMQYEINKKIEKELEEISDLQRETLTPKKLLLQWLDEKSTDLITERQVILMLHEQGILSLNEETIASFINNKYGSVEGVLVQQIERGILKPQHMAIDPFSAAAVVVDIKNGEVLALIGYPSYDPNELITNFNEFYPLLADNSDKRRLLIDRAMRTVKAPGSTFKMISAIAGLEEGTINKNTVIYDGGPYTKAGTPYAKCRNHGHVDLERAIEVSCNYYFYDLAFNLGQGDLTPYSNINRLTKYVEDFGLNQKSGIELPEAEPIISSPEVVVKKGLSSALWNMNNMDNEKKEIFTEAAIQRISKGYIPWADTSNPSLENRIQVEIQHELKRNMESTIGTALEPIMPALINEIIISLESTIDKERNEIVEQVLKGVMSDPSHNLSLRNKTKKYLVTEIGNGIKAISTPIVGQALAPLMDTDITEAYKHSYTVAYGRVRHSSTDQELVNTLKDRMENTQAQVALSKDAIIEGIASGIAGNIVDQILEKVDLGWNEGITIRTAIGQGNNAFAPVQVAKYITALANKEYVYDLRIINAIQNSKQDNQIVEKETTISNTLDISEKTMDLIHKGMLEVTTGQQGTARSVYGDFIIPVGAKTGTAQDGGNEHSWFVGFAPYDKPEVAIVTAIYNSNGAGKYGVQMSREILEAYFELGKGYEQTTIDNIFTK